LNQVELWFAKIEGDLLARGIFNVTRRPGGARIREYIRAYAKVARAISLFRSNPQNR
jgi:hypothetical protein